MGSEGEEREIGCILGMRSDTFKDGSGSDTQAVWDPMLEAHPLFQEFAE